MQQANPPERMLSLNDVELSGKALTVLQAARNVFLSHGYSAATTDMIQREAGVSKSTVYAHFANKETLFAAVIEAECTAHTRILKEIEFYPGRLNEALTKLAKAYLDIVLSPSGLALFRAVVSEGLRFPKLAQAFYQAGPQVITTMVSERLTSAAASGEVDFLEVGPHTAASLFINLVRSEPQLRRFTHPEATASAVQIDHWVNTAVKTFMRAYGCGDYK
ncbi:TetR family transcriptional regulator [Vreelandella aquamarina]|uniref:TetR family transcriptional regulator n=1 Tax=Vreelandella aquamarina TaxID=77097 RepID=A0A6F8XFY8_9GAMM|nr:MULTISPECIES: TetR/AcrR family transcriptional regulator [Oceanospirillales]MCE7524015.1 TetR/AcrR family transcriptional regulator [Alloalcanivorax xenomutans]BCB72829.1 TetR family transcriptional regulator [Halomonas meridiana]|tara:strand:+ start:340 stop:999 length:660 start_codon:yes stop_codon:yes gene_type:complete